MSSSSSLFLNVGNLVGMGATDLNGDDASAQNRPGSISFIVDAYGPRILKYVRNVGTTARTRGELVEYAADGANVVSTSVTATAGSTTSVTAATTVPRHTGMMAYVLNKAATAGAAPEGEVSFVSTHTATILTMEPTYPFSVAVAVNDTVELVATYQVETTAANDAAWTCTGWLIGADGISANNYGWAVQEGYVVADATAANITEGTGVKAGVNGAITIVAANEAALSVGRALSAMTNDSVGLTVDIHAALFSTVGAVGL